MNRLWLAALIVVLCTGCGTCGGNNGTDNNGGETNNETSNAQTNNETSNAQTNNETSNAQTNNQTNAGTNNQTTNNGTGEIPPQEIAQAFHDAICEAVWECPNRTLVDLSLQFYGRYTSLQGCKADEPNPLIVGELSLKELMAAVQLGRIAYDPAKMGECITQLTEELCDPLTPPFLDSGSVPSVCEEALQGVRMAGSRCAHELECQGDLTCVRSGMNCAGVCEMPTPDCGGDTCEDDEWCAPGMNCEPRKAAGEMCGSDAECEEGTSCNTALVDPICVANGSLGQGETCNDFLSCEAGLFCDAGTCEPLAFVPQDEDCGPVAGGGFSICQPGLTCIASGSLMGTCVPPIEEGGSCDQYIDCRGDLACIANRCSEPLADGEFCAADEVCGSFQCNSMNECETEPVCTL